MGRVRITVSYRKKEDENNSDENDEADPAGAGKRTIEDAEDSTGEPTQKRLRASISLLGQMNIMLKSSAVGRMIEELGQSPELQMPKAKGVRKRVIEDGWKTDCGDVYSPPRITKVAARMGLKPAWALDLTTRAVYEGKPLDFSNKEKRQKAARLLEQDKPLLLVVSPMCGPFSAMNNINYSTMEDEEVRKK